MTTPFKERKLTPSSEDKQQPLADKQRLKIKQRLDLTVINS
ncbi:MAG: hypothetical protein PHE33_02405 [Bacteroidales bacterium]|nr:hypothetical protein [Bacteroidales bacterium]